MRWLCVYLLLSLLLLGGLAPALCQDDVDDVEVEDEDYDEEPRAFLIVQKFLPVQDIVTGSNTTVVIEIYNAGSSSAYNVQVQDPAWPAGFELIGGDLTFSIGKIATGARVKHQYFLKPTAEASIEAPAARVLYHAESEDSELQLSYSTQPKVLVISPFKKSVKTALSLGSYATLGALRTGAQWRQWAIIITLATLGAGGYSLYNSITSARKRRRYQKALEEVQKMK